MEQMGTEDIALVEETLSLPRCSRNDTTHNSTTPTTERPRKKTQMHRKKLKTVFSVIFIFDENNGWKFLLCAFSDEERRDGTDLRGTIIRGAEEGSGG